MSDRLHILNRLPLVEVMRAWGYQSRHESEVAAWYICPWHDDHDPSLKIDKVIREDADSLGFECFGASCHRRGFGAVQLAAQLMGLPEGRVADKDIPAVLDELEARCEIDAEYTENAEGEEDAERRNTDYRRMLPPIGWDEFCQQEPQYADMTDGEARFERGEWTEEGLRSLGFKIDPAPASSTAAASSVEGDAVATPALYRCSLGRDYYRGSHRAETRTIDQWGSEVERLFGVQPVSRFLLRKKPEKGGAVVHIITASKHYPIFVFPYPWGIKKYEPCNVQGQYKWTWWNKSDDASFYQRWYADAQLTDALRIVSREMKIEDSCLDEIDERHPFGFETDKDDKPTNHARFERVVLCSGPRDAMAVYAHSNAHVAWLHSEQAGFEKNKTRPNRWLRSFIRKLQNVTKPGGLYVCYDEDEAGLAASQAIALDCPFVRWLRLPKELTEIEDGRRKMADGKGTSAVSHQPSAIKHLKDVTDFIAHFAEVERLMPSEVQHDDPVEWFENAMYDTPSCQFWQWESGRKDKDGTERARYKFDLRNTPVFLRARGMVRHYVQQGKESFSRFFLLGNNNTYLEIFAGEKGSNKLVAQARDLMAEWLRAHKDYNDEKGALSRSIYSAKLEQGILETIEEMKPDEKSYGEDFDHFFFHNTAVHVTAKEIKAVPYDRMKWWTNSEAILDGDFHVLPQAWHVEVAPFYEAKRIEHEELLQSSKTKEEREQENMRWDAWSSLWHYRLVIDKPIEEMPVHFRFLWNISRIFWEKETTGEELTKTEQQMQDMYLIAMLHALGSALVRHRSANRQQFIHITDNGTRREDLASGGTGKTAILELLSLVRKVLKIDGKALADGNIKLTQETEKVVPGLHNIVAIDELPPNFSPQMLYNNTLSLTSRGLYRGAVKLEGDDVPKFVVASNEQLDVSSDSTIRRTYQLLVGDWYHPRPMDGSRPAHTPADDFRSCGLKEVARNLSPTMLNEARNLLLGCTQLFFQYPDETIRPPKDSRAMLRQALAASKDEQFTLWITQYLADKRHLAIPIAKRELAYSLLDYCGIVIGKKTVAAALRRIRDNLRDYIRTSIYVMNPDRVLLTDTDRDRGFRRCAAWTHRENPDGSLMTDDQGNRLPRVLIKKAPYQDVFYFYRRGRVPKHKYSEAHIGDPDYVQPAPEKDPEAAV